MKPVWIIAKREFLSYFAAPIAYVAIFVFLVVVALKFFIIDDFFELGQASLRSFFRLVPIFFVFFIPAIAMRLISEEKRMGTFELLATFPITDTQIILGKFLGALGFVCVALIATLVYPIVVSIIGDPDGGAIAAGYIGLVFLAASFVAVGVMTSAWTKSQIVAYILGTVISALFLFADAIAGAFWKGAKEVVQYVSFDAHFVTFTRGILDSRDVVFFISMTAFFLVIATFSLTSRRWS